ncbi:hypothetical protein [Chryseobacterium sp. S90]|uniref:hypothetical protein n=1 Tax=Chryseobacterium sp. S90 TaxID=3395373 RepID=UPI0039BCE3BC
MATDCSSFLYKSLYWYLHVAPNTGTGLGTGAVLYTGQYLDLPPGKWAVNIIFGMRFIPQSSYTPGTNFVRFRLEDTTANYDASVTPSNVSADAILPKIASTGFAHSMDTTTFLFKINLPAI